MAHSNVCENFTRLEDQRYDFSFNWHVWKLNGFVIQPQTCRKWRRMWRRCLTTVALKLPGKVWIILFQWISLSTLLVSQAFCGRAALEPGWRGACYAEATRPWPAWRLGSLNRWCRVNWVWCCYLLTGGVDLLLSDSCLLGYTAPRVRNSDLNWVVVSDCRKLSKQQLVVPLHL